MYEQRTFMPLRYEAFKQRVRRFPRSVLLRRLAENSAALEHLHLLGSPLPTSQAIQKFTVAGVARTSLAAGNEHRSEPVTTQAVEQLCNDFIQVDDPDVGKGSLSQILTKVAFEQFGVQYSQMENLARTVALFTDHAAGVQGAPTPADWIALLGVDLHQFMRIGFAAYTAMVNNEGSIARDMLLAPQLAPIFAPLTSDQAMDVLDKHFIWTLDQHAEYTREKEVPGREKWSPNSLQARPLVAIGNDLVAPATHYIIERITPTGLYYIAAAGWGNRFTTFTTALGTMFERYVVAQLQLLADATVYTEIVFGASQRKSCDVILVFDEVVVLVEVKGARPTIEVRIGQDGGDEELHKKLGHARDQIVKTAGHIRERHPAFAHIPSDRPRVGLIVTLEPFHLHQTFHAKSIIHSDDIPVTAAWAHDLEDTVACLGEAQDAGLRLLTALSTENPEQRALRHALHDLPAARNPILDDSYQRWATWPHHPGPKPVARTSFR